MVLPFLKGMLQKKIPFLSEKGIGFTCGDKTSEMGRVGFEPTTKVCYNQKLIGN